MRQRVAVAGIGPSAVITVSDTGEGIAARPRCRIVFDRFRRATRSVTRPHGGLGLGLSIVRHIVELHGGQGAGVERRARARRALLRAACRCARFSTGGANGDPQDPAADGPEVLVVDDDADAREWWRWRCAQCGASTAAVGSAREALQMLPEFKPDVLVSDIAMPGEDGYALIRRVRALGEQGLGDVPAVALTALAHPEDRRRALTAGYQQFVPKPVQADELAAVVRTLAGTRVR